MSIPLIFEHRQSPREELLAGSYLSPPLTLLKVTSVFNTALSPKPVARVVDLDEYLLDLQFAVLAEMSEPANAKLGQLSEI